MQIEVWVCHTPGCGNYYGSSSQVGIDLTTEERLSRVEDRDERTGKRHLKGYRADCPNGHGPRQLHRLTVPTGAGVVVGSPVGR